VTIVFNSNTDLGSSSGTITFNGSVVTKVIHGTTTVWQQGTLMDPTLVTLNLYLSNTVDTIYTIAPSVTTNSALLSFLNAMGCNSAASSWPCWGLPATNNSGSSAGDGYPVGIFISGSSLYVAIAVSTLSIVGSRAVNSSSSTYISISQYTLPYMQRGNIAGSSSDVRAPFCMLGASATTFAGIASGLETYPIPVQTSYTDTPSVLYPSGSTSTIYRRVTRTTNAQTYTSSSSVFSLADNVVRPSFLTFLVNGAASYQNNLLFTDAPIGSVATLNSSQYWNTTAPTYTQIYNLSPTLRATTTNPGLGATIFGPPINATTSATQAFLNNSMTSVMFNRACSFLIA